MMNVNGIFGFDAMKFDVDGNGKLDNAEKNAAREYAIGKLEEQLAGAPQDAEHGMDTVMVRQQQQPVVVQQQQPVVAQQVAAPVVAQQTGVAEQNVALAERLLSALLAFITGQQNTAAQTSVQTSTTTSGIGNLLGTLLGFINGRASTPVTRSTTRTTTTSATTSATTSETTTEATVVQPGTQTSAPTVVTPTTAPVTTVATAAVDYDPSTREDVITTAPSADAVAMNKAIKEGYDAYDAV